MLQQIMAAAVVGCSNVAHVPAPDVAYQPSPSVVSPSVDMVLAPKVDHIVVPVVVDLLRGRRAGGRPVLGETYLGDATVHTSGQKTGVTIDVLGATATASSSCAAGQAQPKSAK